MKKLIAFFITLALGAGLGVFIFTRFVMGGMGGPPGGMPGDVPVAVEAYATQSTQLDNIFSTTGNLIANEEIILAPEVAGRVVEINFDEGEAVEQGQVMIRLDQSIYQAELDQAKADLSIAEKDFARAKELLSRGSGSEQARDQALSDLQAARATVALATARLDKTTITAPFDGIAGLRRVSVGDYLSPGQEIVRLVDINPLKLDVTLPSNYLNYLTPGMGINLRSDARPNQSFDATVYAIDPRVSATARTVRLRARVPNDDNQLRPGLFARAEIVLETRGDAILVPEDAIIPQGDRIYVYRILEDDTVEQVDVTVGIRRNAMVEVTNGLKSGDRVVTAGQIKLQPGASVDPTIVDRNINLLFMANSPNSESGRENKSDTAGGDGPQDNRSSNGSDTQ